MFKEGIKLSSNINRENIDEEDQAREEAMIEADLKRGESGGWEETVEKNKNSEMADKVERHELWLQYKAWEMDNRIFGPDKKADEGVEKKLFINRGSNDDGLGETQSDDLYRRFIKDNRRRSKSGEIADK